MQLLRPHVERGDVTAAGSHIRGSMIPIICAAVGGKLSAAERQVVRALHPAEMRPLIHGPSRTMAPAEVATVLTSGISITVPLEPMLAVRDASVIPPYLPRLPYPVTIFELYDGDGDHNYFTSLDTWQVVACALAETEPGREWLAWPLVQMMEAGRTTFGATSTTMRADGERAWLENDSGSGDRSWMMRDLWACAQLATARGAVTTQMGDRRTRRRWARGLGWKPPTIYHLDIGGSHEATAEEGGRVYTCRWLVRGHWRHAGPEGRTWIRPYIKGPVGAPFKGRPTYTVRRPEA